MTKEEALTSIKKTLADWEVNHNDQKIISLAGWAEKWNRKNSGLAARKTLLEKNKRLYETLLKRRIFSDPNVKVLVVSELKWSEEELARVSAAYISKTRKPRKK